MRALQTSGMLLICYLGAGVEVDCSPMISLDSRLLSFIISKLLRTLRLSFQCQRCATTGSKDDKSWCNTNVASGSVDAVGGTSGKLLNSACCSGDNDATALANAADVEGLRSEEGDDDLDSISLAASSKWVTKRLGNSRCWIQYDVPPTTMGT